MTDILPFIRKNKRLCIIFVSVAALLLALSLFTQDAEEKSTASSLSEYKEMLEQRLCELCSSIDGVGKCYVYVSFESGEENSYKSGMLIETKPPRVLGVSVVCQGGDKIEVKRELAELFTSLFDIGANRVKISKLK